MRRIANGRDPLDSAPIEFRTPHASKGSADLSGLRTAEIGWILLQSSSEPRTQVRGRSTCQVASASRASRHGYRTGSVPLATRWVPATRFRECRHARMTEFAAGGSNWTITMRRRNRLIWGIRPISLPSVSLDPYEHYCCCPNNIRQGAARNSETRPFAHCSHGLQRAERPPRRLAFSD